MRHTSARQADGSDTNYIISGEKAETALLALMNLVNRNTAGSTSLKLESPPRPLGRPRAPAESSHVTGVILQKGVIAARAGAGGAAGRAGGSSRRAGALRST